MNQGFFRFHLDKYRTETLKNNKKAQVMCVASGKGGVGKTFFTTNFAKYLDSKGKKVLLIDCDVYLSNCYLSFGVTPGKDLFDLIDGDDFSECVTKVGGIDLISGRNGNEIDSEGDYVKTILSMIQSLEFSYDYILLDCPAGIDNKVLSLMAYCDERVLLLNPNKYSLTDAYSLIKTLRLRYGVKFFKTIINRCDEARVGKDLTTRLINTCHSFLPDVTVQNIGDIPTYVGVQSIEAEINSTYTNLNNVFHLLNDKEAEGSEYYLQSNLEMEFQVSF